MFVIFYLLIVTQQNYWTVLVFFSNIGYYIIQCERLRGETNDSVINLFKKKQLLFNK